MPAEQQQRRLKIVACRLVYSGRNQLNHPYTIYEVDAAKEDGTLVREKLRSFTALPIGQLVEVVITPYVSERHGRSFTLQLKDSSGATPEAVTTELKELRERVDTLTERLVALENRGMPSQAAPTNAW